MIEALKSDDIVRKLGGRFKLTALIQRRLKELIIDALMLEDTNVDDIDGDAPLFVEGLGLDSIDALELAMAIDKTYGVRINADAEQHQQILSSVRSLAEHV